MTSMLTNVVDAKIADNETELTGRSVTRPRLMSSGDEGGQNFYVVDVDVGDEEILRDVAIAAGNNELRYAATGSPVQLKKVAGHWQITGFNKTMPGTFIRYPVTLPDFDFGIPEYTVGTPGTLSFIVRSLTYIELGTLGEYGGGLTPYGALGKFRGDTLLEVYV